MKRIVTLTITIMLCIFCAMPAFAAQLDNTDTVDDTNTATTNQDDAAAKKPSSNTSTDTGNFKLHTGYYDMFMHYDRFLNMKVGEKTKIYIYIPENLYEGAKVTEITNNFPDYISYSGDGTVEALKSIGYGRCMKIHTTVYLPKEDRYEHFTTKIHTYN